MAEIIKDLSFEDYANRDGLNSSRLPLLLKSPKHFYYAAKRDTPSMMLGRAVHCAVLEPEKFLGTYDYVEAGVRRTAAVLERFGSKEVLKEEEWNTCQGIGQALRDKQVSRELLTGGQAEVSTFWELPGNIKAKARMDLINVGLKAIVDLKTCVDASAEKFGGDAYRYHYPLKANWYMRAARACGLEIEHFILLAVESAYPHGIAAYRIPDVAIGREDQRIEAAIKIYKDCVESGRWEDYPNEVQDLHLPSWIQYQICQEINNEQ